MGKNFKRSLCLALVLIMIVAMFPANVLAVETASSYAGQTLYLKAEGWRSDSPRYAAYFFGSGGNKWVSMTNVNNAYYSVEVPAGNYDKVVFCRMNPNNQTNNWNNRYNQTQDLLLAKATGNCFVISNPWNQSNTGYWKNVSFRTLYVKDNAGWNKVYAYMWGEGNNIWPGVAMTAVEGGTKTYSVMVADDFENIIFSNGSGKKTKDLVPGAAGSVFDNKSNKWITPTTEPTTVYFKNTENWETPTAYIFNMGTDEYVSKWPGAAMTHVEDDIWSAEVPAGYHGIIFNNGSDKQTADLFITAASSDLYVYGTGWSSKTFASTTLTGALNTAKEGQTVKVEKDVLLNTLEVNAGTTLDLNGKQVTASEIYAFGNVVDTVGGGSIVISDETDILLPTDNPYMPIYDTANGCYRFFEYEVKSVVATDKNIPDGVRFWFQILFTNAEAYKLLVESENAHVGLDIKVTWTGLEETLSCSILAENVKTFAQNAYAQMESKGSVTCGIYLTVFGLENLESGNVVEATPVLSSDTKVQGTDDTLTYAKP